MDETARTTLEMATTAVLAPSNPPKPKYSEKRKQQNRAAQKTYRMSVLNVSGRHSEPILQERNENSVSPVFESSKSSLLQLGSGRCPPVPLAATLLPV